jgi:hypothetical protein
MDRRPGCARIPSHSSEIDILVQPCLQYESKSKKSWTNRRSYNCILQSWETMGTGIRLTILFLVVMSSVFIYLPHAKGGCGGACAVSGGGDSSYNFMGDPAVTIDMSSFDEFVRDNLGDQTTLQAKSLSQDTPLNTTSSLNQTVNGNASQNSLVVRPAINSLGNMTSDNRTVKLGASGMQDKRLSTLAFAAFNNNMF